MPPTSAARPGRSFCQDDSRVGLLPGQRRRLTVSGVTPVGSVPDHCEHCSRSGAVEPTTGESVFLAWPPLNPVNFQLLLPAFAHHDQETLPRVLLAHGRGHTANALVIPDQIVCLFLPP